jgi:hypothetical protein
MRILRTFLVAGAGLLFLSACGESPAGQGSDGVASIGVEPSDASVVIGSTLRLTATPKTAGGAPVGKTVLWTSENQAVATVTQNGTVTGVTEGSARITASVDGVAGSATMRVTQVPIASITVDPGSRTLGLNGTVQLTATLRDANNLIVTGRPVTWTSSASGVATVDGNGLVRGVTAGSAVITAAAGGTSGSSQIIVTSAPAVVIAAVSPGVLQSGQTATISGTGFGATPAENSVTIAGQAAQVLTATATTLTVTVPAGTCVPAQEVPVRVTVGPNQDERRHPWRPSSFLSVAVGQQLRLPTAGSHCLQFEESQGPAVFLIGVQSVSTTASQLTPVSVRGVAPGTLGSAAVVPWPAPSAMALPDHHHPGADLRAPETRHGTLMRRHREAELRHRRDELAMLEARPRTDARLSPQALAAAAVPGTAAVGDTVDVKYPRTCTQFVPLRAVVRHRGARGIWLEDVANPAGGLTAEQYQEFSDLFDQKLYPVNVEYFGQPTDADGNDRIVIVLTREINREEGLLGRVFAADFPQVGCVSGNAGEYFYGIALDPDGAAGEKFTLEDARAIMPIILAHELTHVIQLGRRIAIPGAQIQTIWELEGQATLTEEVVGHSVTGREPRQNYGFPVIWNEPKLTPIDWYVGPFFDLIYYYGLESTSSTIANAPEQCGWLDRSLGPCLGGRSVYGVSWSFLRWLSDHYGPSFPGGEKGFHRALVDDNRSGFNTIAALTGRPIDELLAQWSAMLYVDGRVPEADPKLQMLSWDFHGPNRTGFWSNLIATAQLRPRERGFGGFQDDVSVRAGSTAYFRVSSQGARPAMAVSVQGSASKLPAHMRLWIVRIQ